MKKSLLFIAGIALSLCADAQLTLNSSNAPSLSRCQQGDSFRRLKINTLPAFTPTTNATWDLTTVADSTRLWENRSKITPPFAGFPNATFYNDAYYNFAVLGYNIKNPKNVTANGIVMYGVHVDRQAISLASFTGGAKDSVVFPLQDVAYSTPDVELKYPMTMGDSWTNPIKFSTAYNLTVAAYSLNNTPGERRSELTIKKSVVGWGKMKVNDENGNASNYMDVLMVKMERVVKDSFYLAGSPAPTALLTAFGLTQGQIQTSYTYSFFRANEYVPLLELAYTDNTFSKVTRCHVHEDRLTTTSVQTINKEEINIYPNPVTNGSFTVKVNAPYKNLNYELYNVTGQMVQQGNIPQNGSVLLNNTLPIGNYIIKLYTDEGTQGVKRLSILQ